MARLKLHLRSPALAVALLALIRVARDRLSNRVRRHTEAIAGRGLPPDLLTKGA
jgi:hypothetical protein